MPVSHLLEAVGVVKRYGARRALKGVTLRADAGQIVGLLGPNGAGKSTLVSIIAGVLRPDAGRVSVGGCDVVADPRAAARRVGIAPQEIGLYEVLTVRENLCAFARLHGLRGRVRAQRVDALGAALRLAHLMDRSVQQLSGGERRRVHTAIAFLHEPALLLLDEPTVGADVDTRLALLDVVRAAADEGAAVVYSTHYLPEIESLAADVAILVGGELVATGPVDDLVSRYAQSSVELVFATPPSPAVRDRLSAASTSPGNAPAGSALADGPVVRVPATAPAASMPSILRALGSAADELRSVAFRRADLDAVYLALTGAGTNESPEETGLVAAS